MRSVELPVLVALAVVPGIVGCAVDDEVGTAPRVPVGLDVVVHDADRFEGTFGAGDTTIAFRAARPDDDRATLAFNVAGKAFRYDALAITEAHAGWFDVVADARLEPDERAAAQAMVDALVLYLGEDTTAVALHEASVPKMAHYLAAHDAFALIPSVSYGEEMYDSARPRSLNDDNKLCIRRNTTVAASYDLGTAGAATTLNVVVGADWGTSACNVGNYSCMGRCGAGCNGFGGGWTLDCLEHDVCSHDRCASGGSGDANCGDEYNHASSDIFSSCSGA